MSPEELLKCKKEIMVAGSILRQNANTTELVSSKMVTFIVQSAYKALVDQYTQEEAKSKKPVGRPKSKITQTKPVQLAKVLEFKRPEK